jgi:hypothetical protein
MFFRAIDLNDVLVAESSQPSGFFYDARVRLAYDARIRLAYDVPILEEQLQRDIAMQFGVPGAEHLTGRALAYALEEDETPPPVAVTNRGRDTRSLDVGGNDGDAAVESGDAVDEAQMPNEAPIASRSAGLSRLPVHRAAIRHRRSEIRERAIVSPQRA